MEERPMPTTTRSSIIPTITKFRQLSQHSRRDLCSNNDTKLFDEFFIKNNLHLSRLQSNRGLFEGPLDLANAIILSASFNHCWWPYIIFRLYKDQEAHQRENHFVYWLKGVKGKLVLELWMQFSYLTKITKRIMLLSH